MRCTGWSCRRWVCNVDTEWLDRIHWFALPILAGLCVSGFLKLCSMQTRGPARRDGDGKLVTPGLVIFLPMFACGILSLGFLCYMIFIGVEENKHDYHVEMIAGVCLIVGLGFLSLLFLWLSMGRIRWDGAGVLRTLPGLKPKLIAWSDLIGVEAKDSGDVVLRGADRKEITFSKFMPGALELLDECEARLADNTRPSTASRTAGAT